MLLTDLAVKELVYSHNFFEVCCSISIVLQVLLILQNEEFSMLNHQKLFALAAGV